MKTHLTYFLAAFAVGCLTALAARAAWFQPYAGHAGHPTTAAYAPMVTNPAAPAAAPHAGHAEPAAPTDRAVPPAPERSPAPAADPHAGHGAMKADAPVNTHCTICGMEVDPSIKPTTYKGKLVGFGCRMCPPKFAADPDRYGPAALENRVVGN